MSYASISTGYIVHADKKRAKENKEKTPQQMIQKKII